MATRTRLVSIVTAALVIIWSSYVSAGIVTINFPTDLASPCTEGCVHNTTADGFRISPSDHYDASVVGVASPCPPATSCPVPGIGWDFQHTPNPDYLGPPLGPPPIFFAALYIDHNGLSFSLLSLESLGNGLRAESSRGGIVT